MVLPTSRDPTLAPPGHHVCLLFTQFAPYHLRDGTWDEETMEKYAQLVFDSIERSVQLNDVRSKLGVH